MAARVLKAQFDSVVVNEKGTIDGEQLEELCLKLDPGMTPEVIDRACDALDPNTDGKITYEEFAVWWEDNKAEAKIERPHAQLNPFTERSMDGPSGQPDTTVGPPEGVPKHGAFCDRAITGPAPPMTAELPTGVSARPANWEESKRVELGGVGAMPPRPVEMEADAARSGTFASFQPGSEASDPVADALTPQSSRPQLGAAKNDMWETGAQQGDQGDRTVMPLDGKAASSSPEHAMSSRLVEMKADAALAAQQAGAAQQAAVAREQAALEPEPEGSFVQDMDMDIQPAGRDPFPELEEILHSCSPASGEKGDRLVEMKADAPLAARQAAVAREQAALEPEPEGSFVQDMDIMDMDIQLAEPEPSPEIEEISHSTSMQALVAVPMSEWSEDQTCQWAALLTKQLSAETLRKFKEFVTEQETDGGDLKEMTQRGLEKKLKKTLDNPVVVATTVLEQRDEMLAVQARSGGGSGGDVGTAGELVVTTSKPNIKQRLEASKTPEWKSIASRSAKWWQSDAAEQVNRLRAAARIRDSLPEDAKESIPDLYPQLIVLGDQSSGKSTVLNRLAEFSFTPVAAGVCTRRPIKLQLRPVAAENRERMQNENLLAICTLAEEGMEDQQPEEFVLRQSEREADESELRHAVEKRASAHVEQDGTAAAFARQYLDTELVVTIQANQMPYFDLIDLPGIENSSTMPATLVKKYLNAKTLARTFVLIFTEHKEGDTQMRTNLVKHLINEIQHELADPNGDLWRRFIDERCLGVLTKIDKAFESGTEQTATDYNASMAAKLRCSLLCEDHPSHVDKWTWVAVLNPTAEEQTQVREALLHNMSFEMAYQKEHWFFDTLFDGDKVTRKLCGIENFREKFIEMYERFVAAQIRQAAPAVFEKVVTYFQKMKDEWAWGPDQECYIQEEMVESVNTIVRRIVKEGRETRYPMTVDKILLRDDVNDVIKRCRCPTITTESAKLLLLELMEKMSKNLIEQVHATSQAKMYRRFRELGSRIVKVVLFVVRRFLDQTKKALDAIIKQEGRCPDEELKHDLVSCAKSELKNFAKIVEDLPHLPARYMEREPPDYLQHAKPIEIKIKPPFRFVCDPSGIVTPLTASEYCKIPADSVVLAIGGQQFNQTVLLECSNSAELDLVSFEYVVPGLRIVPDNIDATIWLYHHDYVSNEYLHERERFHCHRRAAELLVLLFDDETKDHGYPIPEREQFENMEGGKQLVLLEKVPGEDRGDWYAGTYKKRPVRPSNAGPQIIPDVEWPGTCCSEGCANTHDTAFNPCGHTVCCWECAKPLETCPVCGIAVTCAPGIRQARDLCYDHPPKEADHQRRVAEGRRQDTNKEEDVTRQFNSLGLAFIAREADPRQAKEVTVLDDIMRDLQQRPEKLKDQRRLWPYHGDMLNQARQFKIDLEVQKRRLEAKAATDARDFRQQLAGKKADLEVQKRQLEAKADSDAHDFWQQLAGKDDDLKVQKRQLEAKADSDAHDFRQQLAGKDADLAGKDADLEKYKQKSLLVLQSKLKEQQDESEAKLKKQQDESEAKLKKQQEKCQCGKCVIM